MPRPRYTLRAALIATAIAAVIAWQVGIVWKRREAMNSGLEFHYAKRDANDPNARQPTINWFRSLLGDEPVGLIVILRDERWESERDRLQRLFPEATIDSY